MGASDDLNPAAEPEPRASRVDCAGAVYGSMLTASVVATAAVAGDLSRLDLILMVVITGLVFWLAHAYARWAGERRLSGSRWTWREIQRVAVHEWPIVESTFLPTTAIAVSPLLGLDLSGSAWLALSVAVAQQVAWACFGAVRASAPRLQVAAEGAVNLALGVIIMVAKVAISH